MTRHVVVDGSNLATEGRSLPSLTQLNEAVLAYMAEHPGDLVTVVVDATFGHRIDKKEVTEFDEAVANNELVAPPAGAVGRGDAFVLSIANKVSAVVLSNDSFQEFHAQYEWLFDEGRLIGGKPVPHVGWVFVPRLPVRGPVSRKATRGVKKSDGGGESASGSGRSRSGRAVGKASKEASQPMPVPKSPPPGARGRKRGDDQTPPGNPPTAAVTASEPTNALMAFLDFVEKHPVGTTVTAVVDHYSSHGAYVQLGEARGYVPLRYMADPAPRSAREIMKVGDEVTLVVASFNARRRSIDLAMPERAEAVGVQLAAEAAASEAPAKKPPAAKAASAKKAVPVEKAPAKTAPAKKAPAKKAPAKKAPAKKAVAAKKAAATKEPAKTPPAAKAASAKKAAPVEKAPAKKAAPAKRAAPAKKEQATKAAPDKKVAPAKKTPPKKAAPAETVAASTTPSRRRRSSSGST